jgi:hypothetical protein
LFWKKGKKVIVVEGYSDLTQVDESFLSKNLVMVFAEKDLSQASESFLRPKSYYDLRWKSEALLDKQTKIVNP